MIMSPCGIRLGGISTVGACHTPNIRQPHEAISHHIRCRLGWDLRVEPVHRAWHTTRLGGLTVFPSSHSVRASLLHAASVCGQVTAPEKKIKD